MLQGLVTFGVLLGTSGGFILSGILGKFLSKFWLVIGYWLVFKHFVYIS